MKMTTAQLYTLTIEAPFPPFWIDPPPVIDLVYYPDHDLQRCITQIGQDGPARESFIELAAAWGKPL